jgi:hypothetical protein
MSMIERAQHDRLRRGELQLHNDVVRRALALRCDDHVLDIGCGAGQTTVAVTDRTRVVFVNDASFPSGWVANDEEWEAVALVCRERDLWLLYWRGSKAFCSTASRSGIRRRFLACAIAP